MDTAQMWELAKSKRIWVASLCASAYATIPFVLFPVYFVLIIFAIRTGRERAISYFEAPRYGAHLALRVLSAIALAGALRLNFSSDCLSRLEGSSALSQAEAALGVQADTTLINCIQIDNQTDDNLTNLARVLVFCILVWIWIKHDRRLLTVAQLGTAAIVAFAALLVNAALSPRPSSITVGWPIQLVWSRVDLKAILVSYGEIAFQVFVVAAVGYLLGHLCAPCLGHANSRPNRISFSYNQPANWLRSVGFKWYQILAGFVAAAFLAVLFTARNSALYDDYPLSWRYAYDDSLIESFNFDALKTGISGASEALPYIASGTVMIWLLSKVRLTGILPILLVGAIIGRTAGAIIEPRYETPFLTQLNSATLIGMIIAAGFGAAANAFTLRTSHIKTDPSDNQRD